MLLKHAPDIRGIRSHSPRTVPQPPPLSGAGRWRSGAGGLAVGAGRAHHRFRQDALRRRRGVDGPKIGHILQQLRRARLEQDGPRRERQAVSSGQAVVGRDRRRMRQAGRRRARRPHPPTAARRAHLPPALRRSVVDGHPLDRRIAGGRSQALRAQFPRQVRGVYLHPRSRSAARRAERQSDLALCGGDCASTRR